MARARLSPATPPRAYPRSLEQTLALGDGRVLYVRPIVPDDAPVIVDEIGAADTETLYHRFFTPSVTLDDTQLRYLTELDYATSCAVVALASDGIGVAVVRYAAIPGVEGEAEVAFTVKPQWRRLGIASSLHGILERQAAASGIGVLRAFYLADNDAAASLLEGLGYGEPTIDGGIVEVHKKVPGDRRAAVDAHS